MASDSKMTNRKPTVLFIGSFAAVNKDGGTGGQLFACKSLIDSELSQSVNWLLIDSTTKLPIPGLIVKSLRAFIRVLRSIYHILFSKIDILLVFTADGFSILEKGTVCIIGAVFQKKVVIAPVSGYLINDLNRSLYRRFIGFLFAKVDIVLCQSPSWKHIFTTSFPKLDGAKFFVRMNWIDISIYDLPKQSTDVKSESIVLTFIGWVEKTKGIEDLIYAVHELGDDRIHVRIAGDGTYFREAKKLISSLNLDEKIELMGWVRMKEKLALLSQTDIFVFPSHFEGMPNAVLEAMAAGLPIVATEVGGIPDMIVENETGILVRPKHSHDLANAIKSLVDNPGRRKMLGANARVAARRNHSLRSAVDDFRQTILSLEL